MKSRQFITKISMLTLAAATVLGSGATVFAKTNTVTYKKCRPCRPCRPCKPIKPVKPGCGQGSDSNQNDSTGNDNNNQNNNGSVDNNNNQNNNGSVDNNNNQNSNGNVDNNQNVSTQKSFEDQVLELVNKERANYGLKPLTMDESLRNVARVKSSDMSTNNYFSHTSPTYGSPFDMLKTFGIKYSAAAENIAQGYRSPEAVVKGWMNSSGHRANILNARYTKIGVGYEANGNYWTQLFTS